MEIVIRTFNFLLFVPYYLGKLIKSNIVISRYVLSRELKAIPGIVEVDVDLKTERGILTLVNLITMTPGSLSLDLSEDRKKIYVHGMHVPDRDEFIKEIKELESYIKRFAR